MNADGSGIVTLGWFPDPTGVAEQADGKILVAEYYNTAIKRITDDALSNRVAVSVTVNPNVTPTFTAVAPICSGASLSALPITSNNGITGTWSPALDNTTTTTYTFTPDAGQCATTATVTYPLHQPLVFLQIIRVHLWRYGFKNNGTDNAGSYCIV
jgi:hypothetical protein